MMRIDKSKEALQKTSKRKLGIAKVKVDKLETKFKLFCIKIILKGMTLGALSSFLRREKFVNV